MESLFTIDGKTFHVGETRIHRNFKIKDGVNYGVMVSGRVQRDLLGTFYNYTMTIETADMDKAEYDKLYEVLSAPVESHTIIVPYGQGTLSYQAYITDGDDDMELEEQDGSRLWGNLSVQFFAREPQRRAQ